MEIHYTHLLKDFQIREKVKIQLKTECKRQYKTVYDDGKQKEKQSYIMWKPVAMIATSDKA